MDWESLSESAIGLLQARRAQVPVVQQPQRASAGHGHTPSQGTTAGHGHTPSQGTTAGHGHTPSQGTSAGHGHTPSQGTSAGHGHTPSQGTRAGLEQEVEILVIRAQVYCVENIKLRVRVRDPRAQ